MNERDIFINAPENASAEALKAYIVEACGEDSQLRDRVEALVEAEKNVRADFMKGHVARDLEGNGGVHPGESASSPEGPGQTIGNYKLLEKIGEGGFGVVYMADQLRPVKRRVALKIIKLGMDSRQVVARFEAERQALALMDHPNIARIFDGGTTHTGRPFFVMELVRGVPITTFCDEHSMTTRERLQLFTDVCRAVQHAHQKGIIHRDLKPSNVMVSLHDDKAVVKVIDFGVAKAMQIDLTEGTLFTCFEQLLGTPAYMSPEQTQLSGLDIDTRSDIYSLGVLLYELLTGRTPFSSKTLLKAGYQEIRRVIREEEPPKPSTCLNTLSQAELTGLATTRRSGPNRLRSLVRGELDWIVMKALEKDRTRRYATAYGFAEDLRRHLEDEPVQAGPPRVSYRIGKFCRRHKAAILVAATIAILIAAGITSSARFAILESAQRAQAEDNLKIAEQNHKQTEAALLQSLKLEGEAWLGLARYRADVPGPNQGPHAALSAARAIGFEGFGRARQSQDFAKSYPVLLSDGGATNAKAARQTILQNLDAPRPVWRTPATRHHGNRGHNGAIRAIAISPDGQTLASGSIDQSIKIWDLKSGQLQREITGHEAEVIDVCFNRDGTRLYSASADRSVRIWSMQDGREERIIREHHGRVTALALSPDGRHLASASEDHTIKIRDLQTNVSRTFRGHIGAVRSIDFSPDGTLLASAGDDKTVRMWQFENGDSQTLPPQFKKTVHCVTFSPDGTRLAAAGDRLILWNVTTFKIEDEFAGPTPRQVSDLAFSEDGRVLAVTNGWHVHRRDLTAGFWRQFPWGHVNGALALASGSGGILASGGNDGTLTVWDVNGQPLRDDRGGFADRSHMQCLAFSPGGRFLATGGQDYRVRLWDLSNGERTTLGVHGNQVFDIAFSPDGSLLATASHADSEVWLWEVATGRRVAALPVRGMRLAFSPDGGTLAIAGYATDNITLWDVQLQQKRQIITGFQEQILSLAFSPDGRTLIAGGYDRQAKIWDTESGEELQSINEIPAPIFDLAIGPGGHALALGGDDFLHLYTIEKSGRAVLAQTLEAPRVRALAFNPDGRILAAAGWSDPNIRLWNMEDLEQAPRQVTGHSSLVTDLAFAPDGRTLASSSFDHSAVLIDLGQAASPVTLRGHREFVEDLSFSEDSSTLTSVGYDNQILQWDTDNATLLRSIDSPQDRIFSLATSPDGKAMATGSRDNQVLWWDEESPGKPSSINAGSMQPWCVAMHPNGKTLALGSRDHSVVIWDRQSQSVIKTLEGHTDWVRCVAFGPNGKVLASAGDDHQVIIWDLQNKRPPVVLSGHTDWVHGLSFNPDGNKLASVSDDGSARIWNLENGGALVHTIRVDGGRSHCIDFSPDGRLLAIGSVGSKSRKMRPLTLWDAHTGDLLRTLPGHSADIGQVRFSPDGHTLASASRDGTIKLWPLRTMELNLADYLSKGWLQMDAQRIHWPATSDNLYRELKFAFLNVSPASTLGILQSGKNVAVISEELLWMAFRARNWPAALSLSHRTDDRQILQKAMEALASWLRVDWENEHIPDSLAKFRLTQIQQAMTRIPSKEIEALLSELGADIQGKEPKAGLSNRGQDTIHLSGRWTSTYGHLARIEQIGQKLTFKIIRGKDLIHQWTTATGTITGNQISLTTWRGDQRIREERAEYRQVGDVLEIFHIDGEVWTMLRRE